jgi:hypothetical protein
MTYIYYYHYYYHYSIIYVYIYMIVYAPNSTLTCMQPSHHMQIPQILFIVT